ncbi:unnamed protein product, partial [marine sediment metagenome]
MDIINRRFRDVPQKFSVYSQKEADGKGIDYVPWRDCKKGDWVLSDDGYVGQCLDILGPYGDKSHKTFRRYFIFSFGKAWEQKYSRLNYLERRANRSYASTSAEDWATLETKHQRGKRFVEAYVAMFMTGRIDWEKLGRIYRPDQKNPEMAARFIFKLEVFKKMIQQRMVEVFKDRNMSENDVIDMLMETFKKAKKNDDPKEMRKVAEDFIDMFKG